ncbi:MAG TPA: dTDP-4-dehydrorhamnose 3,5-epimerase [Hellea balneolensis]|uniref:dTDP-4-dehydrorhamnose 3,5-epimerase n=1 Tax=Hellea balneolensis TaxID=287478 RepID=A0A7C5LYX3_9PROT|nr:dTDP-4-dehydrorhamnose 3,5-epimerase [Hellea balneolensis]
MDIRTLDIPDVKLFTPKRFEDARGYFMETFRHSIFNETLGLDIQFVQDNHSHSTHKFTLRGLHFQKPPHWQGKLVRCVRGAILDIAVDARPNSRTFGHHVKAELSAENKAQLWVPEGFLHGFLTLSENAEVLYKCTRYYDHNSDATVAWNDPDLAIDWGADPNTVRLSAKDAAAASFRAQFPLRKAAQ